MKVLNKTLIAMAVAGFSGQALAAGFALNSQSANGIGRAISGDAAIGDNAAIVARNPAGMALFDASALSVGLAYADVDIEIKDAVETSKITGESTVIPGIDDAGSGTVIPNIYYVQPVGDKWAFGFAAFSNFGTGSDTFSLEGPAILVGNTDITTADFNASFSYRINDHFSLGLGVDLIYGKGELGRGESENPDVQNNLLNVEGTGWGLGGIIGGLWEINDHNRLGISYRYSPKIVAEGDIDLLTRPTPAGPQPTISFDEIEVPLPDIFQLAGYHQFGDHWAFHYTAQWTGWSAFDSINANGGTNNLTGGSLGDVTLKEYAWKDSWLYSLGGTWMINKTWTVRAGYMHDNGVVDDVASLSIPDSDRSWYTAGFGVNFTPKSALDFGIAIIQGEETEVTEAALTSSVTATTLSNAVYYSLQYSHSF